MPGYSVHDQAVDGLPEHLSYPGDGTIECDECGVVGLRPIGHADDCSYEYEPTREREREVRR